MEVGESKSTTVKEEATSSLSGRPEGQSDPGGSFGLWKQEDDHNMGDAAASVTLPALGDPHSEDTKPVLPSPAKEATPNSLHPQIPDLAPPPQPPAQVDPDLFLSFQTEEDKKVKMEQEESSTNDGPRRSGRVQPARNGLGRSQGSARKLESPDEAAGNGDRKPATRAKKEEDDMDEDIASGRSDSEDEKPEASMRKPGQPVSIAHLPVATEEAMATYEELEFSWYQNKSLGRTRQQEDAMVCDCRYDPETDDIDAACGEHSGCINRLTQVECVASECRCGPHCQNQSFQKREFGPVEIVQTEKKGFGMRATADIARDTFIYEYVGDVIGEKKFTQRMQEYYDEGVIHFYFMMLQKDEFIDATKRGGKGRFFNHSCAPNCYVAKWVVGRKLRMGIFAKRFIEANEELTFNYNVDRYGHEAQECFCGEPNCVGYIGGKTQTDIGGMDDLFLDALGITDEVEAMQLKGSKKKKGRKLDEDFNPTMTQIAIDDVPKVSSAIRQATGNKRIISKLLARILLTEDTVVQRQIMRLHGFSMMSTVLHESGDDNEIVIAVLGVLAKWPLITKNKLQSTNMESVVQGLAENEKEPTISEPAKQLLELWQGLSIGYRIPKAIRETIVESDEVKRQREAAVAEFEKSRRQQALEDEKEEEERRLERERWRVARLIQTRLMQAKPITPRIEPAKLPPPNWQFYPNGPQAQFAQPPPQYICLLTKLVSKEYPSVHVQQSEALKYKQANTVNVNDVIAKAVAEAEEKAALEARNAAAVIEAAEAAKKAKRDLKEKTSREKKLYRLFSTVVVTTMSKYKKYLDSDQFKRRAKEVCDIMCEKERKSAHYATEKYDSLSPEKEAKIKKYVKDFITKLLTRKGIKVSSSSSSSSSSKHHHSSSSRSHSSHSHSRSSTSSRKDKDRHSSSSHSSRPQPGPSSSAVTPGTPTASASGMMRGHVDEDADDMDMDVDAADDNDNDDLINALVDDATGGPDTPESASRTPQLEPEGTNGVKA